MYDVVIIGAGVSGCATARELSRYDIKACVLEKEEDVCCGTSKANSGIVHAGFDARTNTLMARLNVLGNRMMPRLSQELDFDFIQNGSLVVCTDQEERSGLELLYQRGMQNGVEHLRIIEKKELAELEPNVSDQAVAALYAPTAGIVCPFGLNIALAENACTNGVEFFFDTRVERIEKRQGSFVVGTNQGDYEAKCVVNAAGVYADQIHNLVSEKKLSITPRRGEYCLLDHTAGQHVTRTIFTLPGKYGKGILVSPTVHGNLIVGPTAADIQDREGTCTTRQGVDEILDKCGNTVKDIPMNQVITTFAGLRAHESGHEFVIGQPKDAPGFIDCAGIESPGLTSAPAIGRMVADLVKEMLDPKENPDFVATRKGVLRPNTLSLEERNQLIQKEPAYGTMICRCESVTEGEILDAIRRPLGARSLDGIKRRTRAGMGRCQAGFCSPRTMEILSRELSLERKKITKNGGASALILGENKDFWGREADGR